MSVTDTTVAKQNRSSSHRHRKRGTWGAKTAASALVAAAALLLSGCSPLLEAFGFGTAAQHTFEGEPPSEFNTYETQAPDWVSCADTLECTVVYAPLDWANPDSERITLAMVRQPALGSEPALGTLFVNPGGPGASGTSYLLNSVANAVSPDVQQYYDVVAWDPRGTGASSAVTCLSDADRDDFNYGDLPADLPPVGSDAWIEEEIADGRDYGQACLEETGPLLGHVDTDSTVRDLNLLRTILGDEQLNYLGYSYGTKIGAKYADAYPELVGRMVLDGALNPAASLQEVVRVQTEGFEQALTAYLTSCLSGPNCFFTGDTADSLTQINAQLRQLNNAPLTAPDGRTVDSGVALTAIISALYNEQNWPHLDRLFTELAQGETTTTLQLADRYNHRVNGVYVNNMLEAFNAVNCLDYPRDPDLTNDQMRSNAEELREVAPTIGEFQGFGETFCAEWPVTSHTTDPTDSSSALAAGAAPILVLGTTGDPATPYEWAEGLSSQLDSGVLVTLHGEGHLAYGKNACINQVVDRYLITGNAPNADPNCALGS